MPDFLAADCRTSLLKIYCYCWEALLDISFVKILKYPSLHPANMSPLSKSYAKLQTEAGSWIVCSQLSSLQILMLLSYPPEMYWPKPIDFTANTNVVWPVKVWIYSRSEDHNLRFSSFEHVINPTSSTGEIYLMMFEWAFSIRLIFLPSFHDQRLSALSCEPEIIKSVIGL